MSTLPTLAVGPSTHLTLQTISSLSSCLALLAPFDPESPPSLSLPSVTAPVGPVVAALVLYLQTSPSAGVSSVVNQLILENPSPEPWTSSTPAAPLPLLEALIAAGAPKAPRPGPALPGLALSCLAAESLALFLPLRSLTLLTEAYVRKEERGCQKRPRQKRVAGGAGGGASAGEAGRKGGAKGKCWAAHPFLLPLGGCRGETPRP
jgi:hypothetical protein